MEVPDFSHHPLIDPVQAGEIFFLPDDPEAKALQRDMWAGFRDSITDELRALAPGDSLKRDLHHIVGPTSTFGFKRLSAILDYWRHSPDPQSLIGLSPLALDVSARSVQAIEEIFPHLAPARKSG